MAFAFGDDSSFDWGSLLNQAVSTAGQVTSAAIQAANQPAAQPIMSPYYAAQGSYTTTNTGLGNNSMVLLGIAGVLGFVLFMKVKGRRKAGR